MPPIKTMEALRALYTAPKPRSLEKEVRALDSHCKRFIELSRFAVVSTHNKEGQPDVSPRGGESGFVNVYDDTTLLLPDWPGNNRLDTFSNIIDTGRIALMFMVPGVGEVLRVSGGATLCDDLVLRERCPERGKIPKLVIRVRVEVAYLHCAKAIMRSKIWDAKIQVKRDLLPTMGEMLRDHTGITREPESQEEMIARYEKALY